MPTPLPTDSPGSGVHPRELRVSDQEREHVVGLLQRAIGRGLIDLDEFTERTDIAYAATTRAQLNVVLADLPGLVHRDAYQPSSARDRQAHDTPPGQRLELVGHYSTVTRDGRWFVPPSVLVRNKYANTRLDFTEAEFGADVVDIELDVKWGSVHIVIPEGAAVDVNRLHETKYGAVEDQTGTNAKPGSPRILLSGRVRGGSLTVRHPRHRVFGQHRSRPGRGCY